MTVLSLYHYYNIKHLVFYELIRNVCVFITLSAGVKGKEKTHVNNMLS